MATLESLTQEVLSHQFAASQYTNYAQDRINQGQVYVCAQTDFREMERYEDVAVSAGTAEYTLPTDFQRVYTVTIIEADGSATPLDQQSVSDLDRKDADTGKPAAYTLTRDKLRLWPTPDTAYTVRVRYFKVPTTLTAGPDEPEIPSAYQHLLVTYALWHCYERENDYNSAQYHKARFDEDIMKCRGEVQYDSDDYSQPQHVGGPSFLEGF